MSILTILCCCWLCYNMSTWHLITLRMTGPWSQMHHKCQCLMSPYCYWQLLLLLDNCSWDRTWVCCEPHQHHPLQKGGEWWLTEQLLSVRKIALWKVWLISDEGTTDMVIHIQLQPVMTTIVDLATTATTTQQQPNSLKSLKSPMLPKSSKYPNCQSCQSHKIAKVAKVIKVAKVAKVAKVTKVPKVSKKLPKLPTS